MQSEHGVGRPCVALLVFWFKTGGNFMDMKQNENQMAYDRCIVIELPQILEKIKLTDEQLLEVKLKLQQQLGIVINPC